VSRMSNQHLVLHTGIRIGLTILLVAVLFWSFMANPDELQEFELEAVLQPAISEPAAKMSEIDQRSISASMFDVELWHTPEVAEPVVEKPAPQPTRVSLQLMAITRASKDEQQQGRTAVIYDPDNDQIHSVRAGEKIGAYSVGQISDSSVELTDGRRVARLELELLEPWP